MRGIVHELLAQSLEVKRVYIQENASLLISLAERIAEAFTKDRKLLICGNGGSAADAQHLAAEFVNRYSIERPPLPALALSTDSSILTSIGNDSSFENVFEKQVKALGVEGDVLLMISTSGNSANLLAAARAARDRRMFTAGFLGKNGGKLGSMVDLAIAARSADTPRVQEAHILAGHIVCHLVDYILFQMHVPGE